MKKLIIATIIAGLWLIGCSKESATEPTDKPPLETIVTPTQDSVIIQIISMFAGTKVNHYVFAGDTIIGRRNIKVDSLKVPIYIDSLNYTYKFRKNNQWTEISGSGNTANRLQKIVWKKF
jgi:lipopolysaccharide export system protein LptA